MHGVVCNFVSTPLSPLSFTKDVSMKRLLVLLMILLPVLGLAAEQTISMHVAGNCGSCKKKIVRAAEKVDGVMEADWDKDTKVFTVTFNDEVASKKTIVDAVLAAGYDVEDQKGNDAAYAKLPSCCQYRDRSHDETTK